MCGIAFLYAPTLEVGERERRITEALARLTHRGPDAAGVQAVDDALLGHRRLSVVDLAGSPQPCADSSGRYHLTYNGEIYNYREQRERLRSHWAFTSEGDTEVLLATLIVDGVAGLERLEGMWGFALWDTSERRLLLCRDRLGKKPLFYLPLDDGGFACASELPALRALAAEPWQEDIDSTADFLRFGFQLPGYTAYTGVYEVLPGHYLEWTPGGPVRQQPFWSLPAGPELSDPVDAAASLREAMTESVSSRLVADVEVGAFLSGGVDSSLVCALAGERRGAPLQTFTIGFNDTAFDERTHARKVADYLGTRHHETTLGAWSQDELERLVLAHVGQPFADASLLPTALVSRVAAERVKVALSGDGADELFSGYQRYQARTVLRWYTRLPGPLRQTVESGIRLLPEPVAHHSRSILKKAHLFLDIAARHEAERQYVAPYIFAPTDLRTIAPELDGRGHSPPSVPESTTPDDLQQMMRADALVYLPQDILVKVDRAAMAHGLETRAPFLDSRVVSLALRMPRRWHRRGMRGKRMLHAAFRDHLPAGIWGRRKQGFGVPIHSWFRGHLGEALQQMLGESDGTLRRVPVERLLNEHVAGRRDHAQRLWNVYVYLLWKAG